MNEALQRCVSVQQLERYLSSSLGMDETETVEDHVEICEECERALQGLLSKQSFQLKPEPLADSLNNGEPVDDRYEILERIGAGGFGTIWKMRDKKFNRLVAVKVMKPERSSNPALARRFLAEAQICSQLSHPFIVPIHDMGTLSDGRAYFAMKLIEGKPLDEAFSSGGSLMEKVNAFASLCQAVAHAHERGVVHRDLKPQNVMVGAHGEIQLIDWGLAKATGGKNEEMESLVSENVRLQQDQTLAALGTIAYMAPEQFKDPTNIDLRSDVFSLGAVLCQLLTGQPPFVGTQDSWEQVSAINAHLADARKRLSRCSSDPRIVDVANQCLAERIEDRPSSAREVADTIHKFLLDVEDELVHERIAKEKQKVQFLEEAKRLKFRNRVVMVSGTLALIGVFAIWNYFAQQNHRNKLLQENTVAAIKNANELIAEELLTEAKNELLGAAIRIESAGIDITRAPFSEATTLLADVNLSLNLIAARDAQTYNGVGYNNQEVLELYIEAFRERGWDVTNMNADAMTSLSNAKTLAQIFPHLDFMVITALHQLASMEDGEDKARLDRHVDHWLTIASQVDPRQELYPKLRDRAVWTDTTDLIQAVNEAKQVVWHWSLYDLAYDLLILEQSEADGVGLENLDQTSKLEVLELAEQLRRNAQQNHLDDSWVNYQLGTHLISDSNPDNDNEVPRYFQAAIALDPKNPSIWTNLGFYHTKQNEPEEGAKCYKKAIELDSDHFQGNFNLAALHHSLKQFEEADKYADAAIRKAPEYWMSYLLKGELDREQGRYQAALKMYKRALELNPESQMAKKQLALVNQTIAEQNPTQSK